MALIILIGLPGSGKTTVAQALRRKVPSIYISPDEALYDGGVYRWSPERVEAAWDRAYQRCGHALMSTLETKSDVRIIFDAMFLSRIRRSALAQLAKGMGHRTVGIFLNTPLDECARRNAQRTPDRRFPEEKLAALVEQLQPPTGREFDHIINVTPDNFEEALKTAA